MKISLLFVMLFLSVGIKAQSNKVIVVDSPQQFLAAIGSDRTIQIKEATTIHISDLSSVNSGSGDNFRFNDQYDGQELVITGVKNLTIVGLGEGAEIITKPKYGDVLVFEFCNNITIENITAGHGPEKGYCSGGVFTFSESTNITINNSILYGSGMEGITANDITNLECNNTIIRGCTYSIMTLNNCTKTAFNACTFTENEEFNLINLVNCPDVKFKGCEFSKNNTPHDDSFLFNTLESFVSLKKCVIQNNTAAYFGTSPSLIKMSKTKLEGNSFRQGEYKEQ